MSSDSDFSPVTSPFKASPPTSPSKDLSDNDSCSSGSDQTRKKRKCHYDMQGSMTSRTSLRRRLLGENNMIKPQTQDHQDQDAYGSASMTDQDDYGNQMESAVHSESGGESSIDSINGSDNSERDVSECDESEISDDTEQHSDGESVTGSDDDSKDSDSSDDETAMLFDGSCLKTNEALLRILKLYVEERWTKKSLHKNLVMIKEMLPQPNSLPGSLNILLKQLNEFTSIRQDKEHFYCSHCQHPKESKIDFCADCEKDMGTGIFYEFLIEDQLKHMLEQRNLAAAIEYYHKQSNPTDDICDIRDGIEYKKVKAYLSGEFDIMLVWNTDGVALSKSSKQELWPVLAFVCEVPPRLRSSYIVISGVYMDSKKPVMNMFLKPFVNTMRDIHEKGGLSWTHPITKECIKSLVVSPILSADAPAKAIVLNMLQFNGKYGCLVCEQKAGKVPTTYRRAGSPTVRQRIQRRLLYQEEAARLRTGVRLSLQALLAQEKKQPVKGVVRKAIVGDIPFLDLGVCCSAEYMHNVLLGVVKYVLELMLTVRGPWYIGSKVNEINFFMSNCTKVPDFVKRLARSLKDINKASEYQKFLLFYSLPAFEDHLPDEYFQHWLLLVMSMHILLSDRIPKNDLKAAGILLRCFVRDFQNLYEEKYCTYNIHNLLHLELLVERWGPLWATSTFIFEDYNGFMKNHIFGSKHLARELLNNLQIIQSVTILENKIRGREFNFNDINRSNLTFTNPLAVQYLSENEREMISTENNFMLYSRVIVTSTEVYTSRYYDSNKKRANSIVQFVDSDGALKYGEILFFIKSLNQEHDSALCVIEIFRIVHVHIFFHLESRYKLKNLVPVTPSEELVKCPVKQLVKKLLKVGRYLCHMPNSFEINL